MTKLKIRVTARAKQDKVMPDIEPQPGEKWYVKFANHEPGCELKAHKIHDIKPDYVIFGESTVVMGHSPIVMRNFAAYERSDVKFIAKVE